MARFFPDSGALFQHVPRTGGTFVERAVKTLGIRCNRWIYRQPKTLPKKHSLLSHYHRKDMTGVEFVFAFVRHPVSYYISAWQYLCESRMASYRRLSLLWTQWRWHPFRQAALLYRGDFCEWAERILDQEPGWATRLMGWYVGPEGGEFCDYVGRTETLIPDLTEVLTHLGHRVDESVLNGLGRINVSLPGNVVEIPAELRARIEREERVLIRRFYSEDTLAKRWFRTSPPVPENTRLPPPGWPSPGV